MQSARQPNIDRGMAAYPARGSATSRTLVWFADDAVQRRRRSMPAGEEAPSRPEVAAFGSTDLDHPSYAEIRMRAEARRAAHVRRLFRRIFAAPAALPRRAATPTTSGTSTSTRTVWRRPELFGCMALAALTGAIIGAPAFDAGMRSCRTEPAMLASGGDLAAKMTVAHNAACAIWTKVQSVSIDDVEIAMQPQHGTLALRGRSGVTYRPAPQFIGNDFFAFRLRGHSQARDNMSFVRVSVTVK